MDLNEEEVIQIIEKAKKEQESAIEYGNRKKMTPSLSAAGIKIEDDQEQPNVPLISKVQLDKAVNVDYAIKHVEGSKGKI